MGRYTAWDEPLVDRRVEELLGAVVDRIVSACRPVSVVLAGSFGRGEGSVLCSDGKVELRSDFEIGVVTDNPLHRWTLRKVARELGRQLGVDLTLNRLSTGRLKSGLPSNLSGRRGLATIEMYEFQSAARLLYGEDLVGAMKPYDPRDISLWEGIRLVLNRMGDVLGAVGSGDGPILRAGDRSLYLLDKLILACADSLLLAGGGYHYSYRERNARFQEYYPRFRGEMPEFPADFGALVARATSSKLLPGPRPAGEGEVAAAWERALAVCDPTLRFLVRRHMGLDFRSFEEFPELYLGYGRGRGWDYGGPAAGWWRQNLLELKRFYEFPGVYWRLCTRRPTVPWVHLIYSLLPLAFFSLGPGGRVDGSLLSTARRRLGVLAQLPKGTSDPTLEWKAVASRTHRFWGALCN